MSPQLKLTPASSIKPRPIRWLWRDRLPLGAFTLLAGREGIGKTICAYTLAADVTRGLLAGDCYGKPRAVIVVATEDTWEYTIVPRLIAAGADLDLVYRADAVTADGSEIPLILPADNSALAEAAVEVGAALIILDPLISRLDERKDSHNDRESRTMLEPLAKLADKTNATVLGLIHLNKSATTDPLSAIMASRAFVAVARAVLFAAADPADEHLRLLGLVKNNLGRVDLPTLVFRIVEHVITEGTHEAIQTGKLEWQGETDRRIRDVLEAVAGHVPAGVIHQVDPLDKDEAAAWLWDFMMLQKQQGLIDVDWKMIKDAAKDAGHTEKVLKRVRQKIGLTFKYVGFPRRSVWSLPPDNVAKAA